MGTDGKGKGNGPFPNPFFPCAARSGLAFQYLDVEFLFRPHGKESP